MDRVVEWVDVCVYVCIGRKKHMQMRWERKEKEYQDEDDQEDIYGDKRGSRWMDEVVYPNYRSIDVV